MKQKRLNIAKKVGRNTDKQLKVRHALAALEDKYDCDVRFYDSAENNALLQVVPAKTWKNKTRFETYIFSAAYEKNGYIAIYCKKPKK